jgi:hypothetical protein
MKEWVDALISKETFSFARYGDGEWNCILGVNGANCDGHNYYRDLGKRLQEIITRPPDYYIATHGMAYKVKGMPEIVEKYNIKWSNIPHGLDYLHIKSMSDEINEYFELWNNRDTLIVGPEHLRKLDKFNFRFLEIPSRNCWTEYKNILTQIKQEINKDTVVLFCASMMANVLVDDLHGQCTLIDTGSLFDPYCGKMSRTHHKHVKL